MSKDRKQVYIINFISLWQVINNYKYLTNIKWVVEQKKTSSTCQRHSMEKPVARMVFNGERVNAFFLRWKQTKMSALTTSKHSVLAVPASVTGKKKK